LSNRLPNRFSGGNHGCRAGTVAAVTTLRLLPLILASLGLSAHFLRWEQPGPVAVCLLFPFLLAFRKRWALTTATLMLYAGSAVWLHTGYQIMQTRVAEGEPWMRAGIIMAGVALLTLLAALPLRSFRARFTPGTPGASSAAFLLVFVLCTFPQIKMHHPVPLLLERFVPSLGWIEIFGLATYAAWLTEKLLSARSTGPIRKKVWLLFSIVFFAQLLLGLCGAEKFLMTGMLHLPVPAMIIAGPLFRGHGFFMTFLFLSTVIIAGPIWCSWLCYIGSWDNLASQKSINPGAPSRFLEPARIGILAATVFLALGLRRLGVSGGVAAVFGAVFGLAGIGLIAFASGKRGIMIHCTHYCPMGLVAVIAGKINPFRMRINDGCTECRACSSACRYGALTLQNIRDRRPGLTCTLCGDCSGACAHGKIGYRFAGLSREKARTLFLTLAVVLHAVFLGFGRI
jgi:ferredoxin